MDLLLGIDIGTTGTKAMVMDTEGSILKTSYKGYSLYTENINWVEQDAAGWWDALVAAVRDCIGDNDMGKSIKALSISSQGGSLVPVDESGLPLRRAIVWMDTRAAEQKKCIGEKISDARFHEITGRQLTNTGNMVQIKWLKENEPDKYRNTHKFLSTIDFINFKLTGKYAIDPTSAVMTKLFDISKNQWSQEITAALGISMARLPIVTVSGAAIGNLTGEAAGQLGLSDEVKVISGGHDQYCAALGAGVMESGEVMLSTGTAWVVLSVFDSLVFDSKGAFASGCHVVDGKWGLLSSLGTGGACLEWLRNNMCMMVTDESGKTAAESFVEIDRKAGIKAPGADGVIIYPHFSGVSRIAGGKRSKAAILGLDLSHDRYHMARAAMEGVVFEMKWMLEDLKRFDVDIKSLKVLGGATRSSLWMQIMADALGMEVIIPDVTDITCIGAAIIAGLGNGNFRSFSEGYSKMSRSSKRIIPIAKNTALYAELYDRYKEKAMLLGDIYGS